MTQSIVRFHIQCPSNGEHAPLAVDIHFHSSSEASLAEFDLEVERLICVIFRDFLNNHRAHNSSESGPLYYRAQDKPK
ncbi:hypothetical protein [Parahaliea mediterranea]|uniref:Uncharacterized protein n=1 Tax=Parahaliea mediterranea TaxID=651086 RepID=A0A939DCU9_9GAMM|nr:hypothetical protein [Parahaliea mediterranea]MBN7795878.1 hypothetical protein [Parahaliea mediterranea]